ncbi:MAG: PilZ domain-containing protein [Phycisphaerae bacterium]|nr:PilZ domain-containing protein [Phycisphaerae bacterium]
MTIGEVPKLTRGAISEIVQQIPHDSPAHAGPDDQRRHSRLSFHGTVEVRPMFSRQTEGVTGDVRNISEGGLGMSSAHYFEPDSVVEIIVQLPHASFSTKACVRYCKKVRGEYMTGLAFIFGS